MTRLASMLSSSARLARLPQRKVVGDSSDCWGITRSRPRRRSVSALAPQLGSQVILRQRTTLVKALGGPPLTWFYAISGDCSGELLCLFFPLSRLELYPGRFLISAERGCYIAASACEGHAIGGFRRDVQSQVILEERLGSLLELLLGKSGRHFQFEHRSTPSTSHRLETDLLPVSLC